MYGFGFAPFLILLWSATCGIQFVLATNDQCPWFIFIISALIDLAYSTIVTVGLCKKLKHTPEKSEPKE